MTTEEGAPGAGEPPAAAPPDDAAAAWGEDAASGRRFRRWNAGALVVGLVAAAVGYGLAADAVQGDAPAPAVAVYAVARGGAEPTRVAVPAGPVARLAAPPEAPLALEHLPLVLRGLAWSEGAEHAFRIAAPGGAPRVTARFDGDEAIEVPAGRFACRRVVVEGEGGAELGTYWIGRDARRLLVRMETPGETAELVE